MKRSMLERGIHWTTRVSFWLHANFRRQFIFSGSYLLFSILLCGGGTAVALLADSRLVIAFSGLFALENLAIVYMILHYLHKDVARYKASGDPMPPNIKELKDLWDEVQREKNGEANV